MNTSSAHESAVQKHGQYGGVWYPLDERLFKKRVERMVDLIGHIDFTKHCIPDPDLRSKIVEAVSLVHTVAMHYDQKHAWGIYAPDDIDAPEVQA